MVIMWVERLVKVGEEWVWKPEEEKFDLHTDFSMNEDNLNAEICRTGQLMVRYGGLAAEQSANLARKEEHVKLIKSQVSAATRSQNEALGTKTTETALAETVTLDSTYQKALSELHVLRADSLKADHWWRSILKRADLLNAMAFRHNAEIKHMGG